MGYQRATRVTAAESAAARSRADQPSPWLRLTHAHPALRLQAALGNRGVRHVLQRRQTQAALAVGAPGDKYEQEADRVAEAVTAATAPRAATGHRVAEAPGLILGACAPAVQRKLEMRGRQVSDFLQFLVSTTGRRFAYDPTTRSVGPPMRDPFESPLRSALASVAVDRLNRVINDPAVTARVYIDVPGGFPQTVLIGQFTPVPGGWQYIDFNSIQGVERAAPGAGLAMAVHEIYERYRFEALPPEQRPGPEATHPAGPAHSEASRLEPLILRQFGLESGPRRGEDARMTGPAGRQILIYTIRYQRFDLVMRFRVNLAARPMQYLFDRAEIRRH